ncbi:MAG: NAD(P)-dependent oxidoreductase [Candidatus Hydrogenedentota bacterium]
MGFRVAIGPSSFAGEDQTPLRMLEAAGCEVVGNPFGRRLTEDEIIAHLDGIDGLIAGLEPLNAKVIESASGKLKVIARVGIGVINVDFEAAATHGVKVSNTPDGPVNAVAEMTLTALLALCRRLVPTNEALHRGEWTKSIGKGLIGAKVLLVGYGRIGRRVGELMQAFRAELSVYDPYAVAESIPSGVRLVGSLEEGLKSAEIVSLHASGEDCLLGEAEFGLIPDGAILLNSARGELVDEGALIAALDSEKISGCWFDAFVEEPYAGPLTDYAQVLLTPHVGTYTQQCRLGMESAAVENLLRDLGVSS